MTVSSSTNRVSYSGNGTLTTFAYTFKIFDEGDLTVILRASNGAETVQTITTDYTVTGVGDVGGGNVVFTTAPTATETVVILREQGLTQGLDLVPNDPFPAQSLEESLDKLTFMVQQHNEELGRVIKASRTNTITGSEFTISAADRANKVFSFDASGDLAVTQELGVWQGDWATSTAFSVRDIVKDASNNNVYICITAHTSSGSTPISTNTDSAKWALLVDAAAASTSASAAATSATAAASSATAAASSASAAATSATNAATSETNAGTSETNAATSATNAATSETNAGTSETNAASSATAAASSATTASTQASAASTSATNAATSATAASTSASAASTSATNAGTSETNAASSATAAATSATNAATSETNAATSATNSASSATAAASSATSAATSYDNFDDRYLGQKSSDPALDNDGDALITGALYFNTSSGDMKVYTGSAWQNVAPVATSITVSQISDVTATAAELNLLDGVTATTAELNYLDVTTLGTSEASKAVTADANGVITFDNGISEEYTAVTSSSNATTVNLRDSTNFSHTLTENTTFTFSNPASSGKVSSFTLKLVQDASASGYTVTWPSSVDWPAATAPTLTATASAVDYFVFITHDGGTTWYGFTAGQALG
jgi:hypothetical protein